MTILFALILCTIFVFLSGLHVYWALGGTKGISTVIPSTKTGKNSFTPSRVATLSVASALFIAALLPLLQVGLLSSPLPDWIARAGVWLIALVFLFRALGDFRYVGFFKRVRGTVFAYRDTRFYSPLCLFLALLAMLISVQ